MPKIIDNIKETILTEAKKQLFRDGYTGMTLRSVARGCHIAVGTIYNYFPSKELLAAAFLLDDWTQTAAHMQTLCTQAQCPIDALHGLFDEIVGFSQKYAMLFNDAEARRSAGGVFAMRHAMLRRQMADCIRSICERHAKHYTAYLPEFIAEAILAHASEKREFSELSEILIQLFQNTEQE